MQLLLRQWHSPIKNSSDQKKLTITDKGLVVLDKMVELQKIMDPEKTHKMKVPQSKISVITVLSK